MSAGDKADPGFHRPFAEVQLPKRLAVANAATTTRPQPGAPPTREVSPSPLEEPAVAAEPDEATLFAEEMQGVKRSGFGTDRRLVPRRPRPPAEVGPASTPDDPVVAALDDLVETGRGFDLSFTPEYVEGLARGTDRRLLRRLKRGDFTTKAHLDLHGKTRKEARCLVEQFIAESRKQGLRCITIIHGRGLHSKDRTPVLKDALTLWLLRGRIARSVLAFCSARAVDGGLGAVYVLLRK